MSQIATQEQIDKVIAWTRAGRKLETQPYDDDVIVQVDEWSEREGAKAKNIILEQNKRMFSILKRSDQPVAQSKIDADFKKEIDKIERLANPGQGYVQMRIDLNNKLELTLKDALKKLCINSNCITQQDANNITEPINKIMYSNPADVIGCYEKAFKEVVERDKEIARGKKIDADLKKICSNLTPQQSKSMLASYKKLLDSEDDIKKSNDYGEQLIREIQIVLDEKTKQRELVEKELLEEENEAKKKTSKTKKPSKVTKPVGGGGSAQVLTQVSAKPESKPTKSDCEILIDTVQQFIKDIEIKTMVQLAKMKLDMSTLYPSMTKAQQALINSPSERINGRIIGLLKTECLSNAKIIADTMKKSGDSNGKKFELYLINKTLQFINSTDGFEVLYDRRGIMNNESHPDLQVVATGQSYSLAEASMYDFSTPTHDIEVKFYLESSSDSDIAIPMSKFFGSSLYVPYFRIVDRQVKLYNIWCEQLKDWVNKDFDKEIIFVIMTSGGIMSYNYTDELTRSANSSGWRKTPFDIKLNPDKKKDREGGDLYYVDSSTYKDTKIDFGDGVKKDCFLLPSETIKKCYIKK